MPLRVYQSNVISSGAKMPFCASASAIMLATVLRYGMGSWRSASTNSTLIPCACALPQRRSSASTTSLPLTQGRSFPLKTTRRRFAGVK